MSNALPETIIPMLEAMKDLDASDLHLKTGIPPHYRIAGRLRRTSMPAFKTTEREIENLMMPIIPQRRLAVYEEKGGLDFSYHLENGERFRCNIMRAGEHMHAAIRRVKPVIPDFDDTRNNVRAGSIASVTDCTQVGTVESSTISSGYPAAPPRIRRSTSGPRLLPPMPNSTTCRTPDSRTCLEKVSSSGRWPDVRSITSSQPSLSANSVGSAFQTVWSLRNMRETTSCCCSSWIVDRTSGI